MMSSASGWTTKPPSPPNGSKATVDTKGDIPHLDPGHCRHLGIETHVSMKTMTTFRIGGPADYVAVPETVSQLVQLLKTAESLGMPVTLMGGGTNLLVLDGGIRGLVISLSKLKGPVNVTPLGQDRFWVSAPAGTSLTSLYRQTRKQDIGGLAFAAGIPGTLGGAVMMNAGTRDGAMSDVVERIETADARCGIVTLDRERLTFSPKALTLPANDTPSCRVITRVTLALASRQGELERRLWQEAVARRKSTQPLEAAGAGCFFKNPISGPSAGALIDRAGLKGTAVGDAAVSTVHANFIINRGSATAAQVLALADLVREKVRRQFGIILENEVKIEGQPTAE